MLSQHARFHPFAVVVLLVGGGEGRGGLGEEDNSLQMIFRDRFIYFSF